MTLTPPGNEKGCIARFTQAEKDILFELFKEYEEIIDIKYRKKSRRKTLEVRQCWQEILDSYNNDPQITTRRNLKQIQKFWLNSRLRKRYPQANRQPSSGDQLTMKQIYERLKCENEIENCSSSQHYAEEKEQIIIRDPIENRVEYEIQVLNSSNEMIAKEQSNNDPRQISIETISNDNISLNDLIEFKNSRHNPQDVESKPVHHNSTLHVSRYNEIQDDHAGPSATIYSPSTSGDCYDSEQVNERNVLVDQDTSTAIRRQRSGVSSIQASRALFNDKLNSLRIKEAELKLKEQELRMEKQKVELAKSQEELRHLKEMNELASREMKIKVKLLEQSILKDKQ